MQTHILEEFTSYVSLVFVKKIFIKNWKLHALSIEIQQFINRLYKQYSFKLIARLTNGSFMQTFWAINISTMITSRSITLNML